MSVTLGLDREQKPRETPVFSVSSSSLLRRYEAAKEEKPAVEVQGESVSYNMKKMELNKFYLVELKGEPYIYCKISDHEVEIYGLAEQAMDWLSRLRGLLPIRINISGRRNLWTG